MKGSLTLLGATVAGFFGVLTLHVPSSQSSPVSKVTTPTQSTTATTTTSTPQQPPSGSTTTSPTTTTTTVPVPSTNVNGSATGQVENYSYGQLAVMVTITNNRIVGLSVESLQTLESYSQQLEQYAVPILKNEVLQAQSARINAVSGATYTSEAYAYSIQGALDKLHFK
jgi:uncharacterized protein with FMN-binding domain